MKRIVIACAVMATSPMLASVPAVAQGPVAMTRDACWRSVADEARGRFAARDVSQLTATASVVSPVENAVRGRGMADGMPFAFSCTYNLRSGRTYAISIRPEQRRMPLPGGSWAETCVSPQMRGSVLFAQCRMAGGGWNPTRLDMRSCSTGRVANLDGALVCR